MHNFLCQNDYMLAMVFKLYQVSVYSVFVPKCFNTSKLYTVDVHYSVKIGSIYFFLSSDMQKFYHF